jgi:hypothetical protein
MNIGKLLGGAVLVFVLIQLVPFGRNHTNPPVIGEPQWNSPATLELFNRACKDCHSNLTVWPWYSNVAPISWLIQLDVNIGRDKFNVSEWGREGENEGDEASGEVKRGKMPPWFYLPAHSEAKLTSSEKQELINGLAATFGEKEEKK